MTPAGGKEKGYGSDCEHSGEGRTHTAHDHNMTVFFIETEPATELISDTSAKLDRSTLATGRSAGKMREDRGDKNQRCRAERYIIL